MTETNEQVTTRCGHPGCGKPIVWSIDGWMHESALDQWLSDEAHAAIPEEDSMAHPDEETTVLTPVGDDKMVEQDPHEWLASDEVENDFDDDDDDFDDVPPPPAPQVETALLNITHQENAAAFQEASRLLRLTALEGVPVTIENILEVARFIKGEKD